ncbi:MAG: NDP-sugar synthase [Spirochaetales bacterium]
MKPALVVLAAGMGSRYGGIKQIDPVGPDGEAILDYSVYDALEAGFGSVVFVIRRDIEEEFRRVVGARFDARVDVRYAFQDIDDLPVSGIDTSTRAKPWGTAHAVWAARHVVDTPFAVINADDFYGREAYRILAAFLAERSNEDTEYAMVGFRVDRTTSPNGSVSRAVCETDSEGFLRQIVEHKNITVDGETIITTDESGARRKLEPDTTVSMNMFGFTPTVFDAIAQGLSRFLETKAGDPKAEYYIPTVLDERIRSGQARVRVLQSSGQWFGVTYREDRPGVVDALESLALEGNYPRPLWG